MNFKEELVKYQNYVNNILQRYIEIEEVPEKKLNESMRYSLLAGGKRIRPILMIATYKLFDDNIDECIPFFVAMEMVHNFSLIHDDLPAIDNDDFRHGKPTNHKVYGESTAILAGDALLNNAYIVISDELVKNQNNNNNKIKALNEFSKEVSNMIKGEFIDIQCENKKISIDLLEYMHKNKTGALIKEAVRIGAILGDATQEDLDILTMYSNNIGLAFQIKDDILSYTGDESIMGKPVHNDEKNGKSTYVSIYGIKKSEEILEQIVNEAIVLLHKRYGKKAEFLVELAKYIKDRKK